MLPKHHRILRGEDFRRVTRRGRRRATALAVVFVAPGEAEVARVGFIITRKVGNSVTRHRLKRQLAHIVRPAVLERAEAVDIVVRVHPEAANASFAELEAAVLPAVLP